MFSKTIIFVSVVSLRFQNCRDLHAFLGVKFSSRILLRVKELTFCNSGVIVNALVNSHVDSLAMFIQFKVLPVIGFSSNRFPSQVIMSGLKSDCRGFNPICVQLRFDNDRLFLLVLDEGGNAKEGEEKKEEKNLENCLGDESKVELHIINNVLIQTVFSLSVKGKSC